MPERRLLRNHLKQMINYTGISESRTAPVAAGLIKEAGQTLIIVSSDTRASRLAGDLSFFLKDKEIVTLYGEEGSFTRYDARNRDVTIKKLKVLQALRQGVPLVVVAPVSAAIKKLPPHAYYEKKSLSLEMGKEYDLREIAGILTDLGYERYGIVEGPGQFSLRGGILDVFTPESENPVRIEFFGEEVDSIRTFDSVSQRSIRNLKSTDIYPAREIAGSDSFLEEGLNRMQREYKRYSEQVYRKETDPDLRVVLSEKIMKTADEIREQITDGRNLEILPNYLQYFFNETEYIWDYMDEGKVLIDDPDRIYETLELMDRENEDDFEVMLERGLVIPKDRKALSGTEDFVKAFGLKDVTLFTPFPKRIKGADSFEHVYNLQSRQPLNFAGKMNVLEAELRSYLKKGYEINILSTSEERLDNLREFCERAELKPINFLEGSLSQGIDFPLDKRLWLSDNDIFSQTKKKRRRSKKDANKALNSFTDLHEGDFVVHENHGIGKFVGIHQLKVEGEIKDYIKIKYAGNDLLYVPVEQMDMVQKYIGGDDAVPKINKLSGSDWKVTKAKAKAAIAVMAKDLIDLYAQRQLIPGHSFGEDTPWQKEFEDSFPFEETDDQLRAAEEIKKDMARPYSMDRLLLGDVGLGKTEVAARAIFKCLADGKQAAMLVPTTILANQHYYTLKERFEKYPFTVDVLSRFRSPAQQKETVKKMKSGEVDLVIGTHRLLSEDIGFKDLGLLVVDEEQRFGVEHKEKIKKLRTNVDVLTLSATPIPRTLNMSLTGIKDMSMIEEPPEERYPVQTYVMEQDDSTIREVIEREMGRGGQVFVVYNRVRGLSTVVRKIQELVPEARVISGHGQMNEGGLEKVMMKFIDHEADVLVSTTIIESGLDIPNANTMIVLDAERYGLSQLYQMRGRVGRSNKIAYCYLMYHKDKVLTEPQEKRLKAIREFTEFGAGFKVAMKDLEIRGAGNMLGTAQSGHILNIGYDLYCKMVDNAVRALKGEIVNDDREESAMEFPVSAYIPGTYIEDESLKLEMYKRISGITSRDDMEDVLDELSDRFGDVPRATQDLIRISYIRYLSEQIGIEKIHADRNAFDPLKAKTPALRGRKVTVNKGRVYVLDFREKNGLTAFGIVNAKAEFGGKFFAHMGAKPFVRLSTDSLKELDQVMRLLEILVENTKTL